MLIHIHSTLRGNGFIKMLYDMIYGPSCFCDTLCSSISIFLFKHINLYIYIYIVPVIQHTLLVDFFLDTYTIRYTNIYKFTYIPKCTTHCTNSNDIVVCAHCYHLNICNIPWVFAPQLYVMMFVNNVCLVINIIYVMLEYVGINSAKGCVHILNSCLIMMMSCLEWFLIVRNEIIGIVVS